jgi:signal peptidase I
VITTRQTLAAELLRSGHAVDYPLFGCSMYPLLRQGDTARVTPACVSDVRPGDVVFVAADDRVICHRLMYKTASTLVTRGDNVPVYDPPFPHSALLGRVEVPPSPLALLAALRALGRP